MSRRLAIFAAAQALLVSVCLAQTAPGAATKPAERITGTITAIDQAAHTIKVKEDKTGTEYTVDLAGARTLLKVEPGAKDLHSATRITANDLAGGDRVQVGAAEGAGTSGTISARSVILMSARDLQQAHQAEAAEWQHSTPGVVTAVDATGQKLNITARTPAGIKPMTVDTAKAGFTRYSPDNPQTPVSSQLADIQAGDQVRIIGEASADGSSLAAQKIYSSSFRTVVGTVSSIAPDGKQITIKNLQTKQPVTITLNDNSAIRRLPQMTAYRLARRFNPDFRPPQGGPSRGSGNPEDAGAANAAAPGGGAGNAGARSSGNPGQGPGNSGQGPGPEGHGPGGPGGGHGMGPASGDLSQTLGQLPKISASDLKSGDAVVISGYPNASDPSRLVATNVIAGVEPIFQSASPRQAQSLGDWGASLGGGGADMGGGMPGGPPQ